MKKITIHLKNEKAMTNISLSEHHFYQLLLRDLEFDPKDEPLIKKLAFKEMLQEMYEAVIKSNRVQIEFESTKEKEELLEMVIHKLQAQKELEIY